MLLKKVKNILLGHLIAPYKPSAYSNTTTHHKTNFQHHKYRVLQVSKSIKYYSLHLINNTHSHLQEMKNTPDLNLNHLITPCKPPACSNTTTHHKTNHKHHNYNAYKYWHQVKYYSSHLIKHRHSHLQEMKNTYNISLSHLITPCKTSTCSNTTTHHKTNHKHHKYNAYKYWNQIK